jgi:hypothetical protein
MTATKTYRVIKTQRGTDGRWFRYAPVRHRFTSADEANTYAQQFAESQAGVGGTRIIVVSGRKTIATFPVR